MQVYIHMTTNDLGYIYIYIIVISVLIADLETRTLISKQRHHGEKAEQQFLSLSEFKPFYSKVATCELPYS